MSRTHPHSVTDHDVDYPSPPRFGDFGFDDDFVEPTVPSFAPTPVVSPTLRLSTYIDYISQIHYDRYGHFTQLYRYLFSKYIQSPIPADSTSVIDNDLSKLVCGIPYFTSGGSKGHSIYSFWYENYPFLMPSYKPLLLPYHRFYLNVDSRLSLASQVFSLTNGNLRFLSDYSRGYANQALFGPMWKQHFTFVQEDLTFQPPYFYVPELLYVFSYVPLLFRATIILESLYALMSATEFLDCDIRPKRDVGHYRNKFRSFLQNELYSYPKLSSNELTDRSSWLKKESHYFSGIFDTFTNYLLHLFDYSSYKEPVDTVIGNYTLFEFFS